MSDEMTSGTTTLLPAPPAGWFDYRYAVLWNGDMALVRTDCDFHTEFGQWRDQVQSGNLHAPKPSLRDARLRLSKFDGGNEIGAIEVPAGLWPTVDCLADGRWLVAASRSVPDEKNARLFTADGAPAGAFAVGDAINHIRCAADGTIWVGYSDEGVFARPNQNGSRPVSSSGIARFGADGSVLWRFNSEESGDLFIIDCYALALDGNTLWSCPYTDFPIVRVKNGVVVHWRNHVAGASALAVDGDYVLLAGGYNDKTEQIALLRLDSDQAQQIGEWRFQLPERNAARLLQGLGATLHIIGQGRWTKLSLTTIRTALKA
jgi:hypothetical protein